MEARAVADDVDPPDPGRAPARGDLAGGPRDRVDRRPDRGRTLADLGRDRAPDHRAPFPTCAVDRGHDHLDAPPAHRGQRLGPGSVVRDQRPDLVEPEHEAWCRLVELRGVGEDDDRARHPAQRPVDEDLRHRVVHQALVDADRADAHEQRVGPQLGRGELGEVAEHRVHPRPDDAAEDDQLDPLPVEQRVRDVEGVGDHRQPPVRDLAGEGQRRRAAADGDRRVVRDERRRRAGDRPLRRLVRIRPGRHEACRR